MNYWKPYKFDNTVRLNLDENKVNTHKDAIDALKEAFDYIMSNPKKLIVINYDPLCLIYEMCDGCPWMKYYSINMHQFEFDDLKRSVCIYWQHRGLSDGIEYPKMKIAVKAHLNLLNKFEKILEESK